MAARFLAIALMLFGCAAWAADPAVEAVLELPRERPIHYVDAVLALFDLGEAEQASAIAEEFAALEMSDDERIALVQEAGTARLLRLASEAPVTATTVTAILRAAETENLDPKRLRALFRQLVTGDADEAREAMLALERTGSRGVDLCLSQMRKAADTKHAARLREALVTLYPESGPALVVALEDESPAVREQAAFAWGRLADLDLVRSPLPAALLVGPSLLGEPDDPASKAAAWSFTRLTGRPVGLGDAAMVEAALDAALAGTLPFSADIDGMIGWPRADGSGVSPLPARDVAVRIAAALADDLAQLRAGDPVAERRALVLGLEAERASTEGRKLSDLPTTDVSECLRLATEDGFARAAIGCCELLGERKDPSALLGVGGRPAPLAAALEARHDAVRFVALEAILKIAPEDPFAGSSRVADALRYFAAGTGSRKAVIVAPQIARAANTAGLLAAAGYEATPVNNGADGVAVAATSPDVELILLDVDTIRPSARETLFRLRRTPATATVPVGLLAADGRYGAAQALADDHADVLVSARLHEADDVAEFSNRLASLGPRTDPDSDARRNRADQARAWIGEILADGPAFYRLRDASRDLEVALTGSDPPHDALAALGTPSSQLRLLEEASGGGPIEARDAAAAAFKRSVERHGVLLTRGEILRQYALYNASETADAKTQDVLGAVLDAIEAGRQRSESGEVITR